MNTPSSFAPTSTLVAYWFTVPVKTRAEALKNGFTRCPSEIAIRPQTGGDIEAAMAGDIKAGLSFQQKMIQAVLCGVNFDPDGNEAGRKAVSRAAAHPDYHPSNVYAALPAAVCTMLGKAFSTMNEPEQEDLDVFLQSRSTVTG